MAGYFGVIYKDQQSDYGIAFPDLPGCVSAGSSLEELDAMAREALKLHLAGMQEDGQEPPSPTPAREILAAHGSDDGFQGITLVTAPHRIKRVRVNISLPEQDLRLIDAAADKLGMDRSGFLISAAKSKALGACD